LLTVALLLLPVSGCADPEQQGSIRFPEPNGGQLPGIAFTCRGGVGGVNERLQVEPTGVTVLTNGVPGTTTRDKLSADERSALLAALRTAATGRYRERYEYDGQVTDLFEFSVEIAGNRVTADNLSIPERMNELVRSLQAVARGMGGPC